MSCERFEHTWEEWLEGRLEMESDAGAAILRHARACAECAVGLRVIESLRSASSAFAVPDPPASYWAEFSRRLEPSLASDRAANSNNTVLEHGERAAPASRPSTGVSVRGTLSRRSPALRRRTCHLSIGRRPIGTSCGPGPRRPPPGPADKSTFGPKL